MENDRPADLRLQVLINIREEIRGLRQDTKIRFEQVDKRFERIERDISSMKADTVEMKNALNAIVVRFDRDYLPLASEMDSVKGRLRLCEQRLGITQ